MPWRFLEATVVAQVLTYRAGVRAMNLFRRFGEHRKLYPTAAAGLRAGYALSAVAAEEGSVLKALRRMLDLMRTSDDANQRPFQQLVEVGLGRDLGQFLLDMLAEPLPPVARVRVERASARANAVQIRFHNRAAAGRFAERIRLSGLGRNYVQSIDLSGRAVSLKFA